LVTRVIFTAVHVVAIVLDSFVSFSVLNVLVPFTGSWHPVAVAWGIVAMYALAAVEITSLLRTRISKQAWRATHYLSFRSSRARRSCAHRGHRPPHVPSPRLLAIGPCWVSCCSPRSGVQADQHDVMTPPRVPVGVAGLRLPDIRSEATGGSQEPVCEGAQHELMAVKRRERRSSHDHARTDPAASPQPVPLGKGRTRPAGRGGSSVPGSVAASVACTRGRSHRSRERARLRRA